jgi:hypothetical protein
MIMKTRNNSHRPTRVINSITVAGRIALCVLVSQLGAQELTSPVSTGVAASMITKSWLPVTAAPALRALLNAQEPPGGAGAADFLTVTVAEGEGTINTIGKGTSHSIVIQVQDAKGVPVEDAVVTFLLPSDGPSGTFPNGTRNLSVTTDNLGRAVAAGFTANDAPGVFEIKVTVTLHGGVAHVIVHQTNSSPAQAVPASSPAGGGAPPAAATKKSSNTLLFVLLGIGAAAGVGVALGSKGNSSSSSSNSTTTTTSVTTVGISIGSGSLGH